MKSVYKRDFQDIEGLTLLRLFVYGDPSSLDDAKQLDIGFIETDYISEIERSGFYYYDIKVERPHE